MWESIKKLLITDKDKAILVEDGQPRYVVLSVGEYLRLVDKPSSQTSQPSANDVYQGASFLPNVEYPGYSEEPNIVPTFENELPLDVAELDTYKENPAESESFKDINLDDLPV